MAILEPFESLWTIEFMALYCPSVCRLSIKMTSFFCTNEKLKSRKHFLKNFLLVLIWFPSSDPKLSLILLIGKKYPSARYIFPHNACRKTRVLHLKKNISCEMIKVTSKGCLKLNSLFINAL